MRVFYQCGNEACGAAYRVLLLGGCPRCGSQMFEKEAGMPKSTAGGASNADAGPGEVGYVEPAAPAADAAPVGVVEAAESDPAAPEHGPEGAETEESAAPAPAAPKAAWAAYQVGRGLDPADADRMRKAELVAWEPPAPGDIGAELTITAEATVTRGESEETGE